MAHAAVFALLAQALAPGRWAGTGASHRTLAALGAVLSLGAAHAQMVPRAEHALRQAGGHASLTTVRISWGNQTDLSSPRGQGLNLSGQGFWPHWEGRIGAVIDRPVNPLKDTFVLAQPLSGGLRVRSLHVLSDYYLEGGFRATAGLLRGETGQAWWSSGDNGGGLNLSLQHLDTLGLINSPGQAPRTESGLQTMPYFGAGYSSRMGLPGQANPWRFNADLGLVTVNTGNRVSQVLQGDKALDALVRDLRLRPMVKVSVGYSF